MRWITLLISLIGAALWSCGVLLPSEVHYASDPGDVKFPTDLGYTGQSSGPRQFDEEVSLGRKWQWAGLATLGVGALAPILVLVKKQSLLATATTVLAVVHGVGFVDVIMRSSRSVEIVWLSWFSLLLGHVAIFGAVALCNRQSEAKAASGRSYYL